MPRHRTTYKKNSDESKALAKINEWITLGSRHCEPEHSRCEDNAHFERGEQWSTGDAERQKEKERPSLALNSIHKLLNAVANREIMDRYVPKVYAKGIEDGAVSEIFDAGSMWQRDLAETEHEESQAFRRMCASGYGVMHKWFDPLALDGDGMLKDEEVPLWTMIWDPMARAQNLVDRKWHMCGKYVTLEEAEAQFGDVSPQARAKFASLRHKGKFEYDSEHYNESADSIPMGTWNQIRSGKWLSLTGREVFLVEAEWKEIESYYRVAYPVNFEAIEELILNPNGVYVSELSGEPIEISNEEYQAMEPEQQYQFIQSELEPASVMRLQTKKELNLFIDRYRTITGEEFEDYANTRREVIKYAILIDNCILELDTRSIGFTYEFMTGFRFETRDTIQFYGMIDVAKAPQDFKNVFFSNMLSIYMTSPKQHLIIEESALKDVDQFLNEYAKLSGVSIVPDGFVNGKRYLQMDSPTFPPMLETLVNIVEGHVQEIFGLSSIEMNSQGDLRRVSGNVVQAAKAASNTLLAVLFDALRRYRKRWGLLTVKSLMSFYTPAELNQIVGDASVYLGFQFTPLTNMDTWPDSIRFDIKIDEAPTSITEQIQTVDFLTRNGTLEKWVDTGKMTFGSAIDMLVTLPKSVREKIKEDSDQLQQLTSQIQQLQQMLEEQTRYQESLIKFIQTQPGGGEMVTTFQLLNITAQKMAAEMHQQMMQQQQEETMNV